MYVTPITESNAEEVASDETLKEKYERMRRQRDNAEENFILSGVEEGVKLGKPMILLFSFEGSDAKAEGCKKFYESVMNTYAVSTQAQNFTCLKIDMADEDNKAAAKHYRVSKAPTIIFLSPDGKVIKKVTAGVRAKDLAKFMQKIVDAVQS